MFDRQVLQYFFSGWLSVFRFGSVPIKESKSVEITEYFDQIRDDVDKSYKKLEKQYERH